MVLCRGWARRMHELSVCRSLLQEVLAVAEEHGASRVVSVSVRLGPLSGVDAGLLQQAFPLAAQGGLAQAAQLHIETSALRIWCPACEAEHSVQPARLICPVCGAANTRLLGGAEMLLINVELVRKEVNRVQ